MESFYLTFRYLKLKKKSPAAKRIPSTHNPSMVNTILLGRYRGSRIFLIVEAGTFYLVNINMRKAQFSFSFPVILFLLYAIINSLLNSYLLNWGVLKSFWPRFLFYKRRLYCGHLLKSFLLKEIYQSLEDIWAVPSHCAVWLLSTTITFLFIS